MHFLNKDKVTVALGSIKAVEEFNVPLLDATHGASSGQDLSPERQCYQTSKNNYFEPQEDLPEFEELGTAPHSHCKGMMARTMARLVA